MDYYDARDVAAVAILPRVRLEAAKGKHGKRKKRSALDKSNDKIYENWRKKGAWPGPRMKRMSSITLLDMA